MIEVRFSESGSWSVIYRMEGVQASHYVTTDLDVAVKEIRHKMTLERGLVRGKVFTSYTGKGI